MRDYHIHLGYGNFRLCDRDDKFDNEPLNNAYNNLLEYNDKGFTYLRDGGDKHMLAFSLKKEAKRLGIRLDSPGRALVKANCYGKQLGYGLADLTALKAELDFLLENKVDLIKVIFTGLVNCTDGKQQLPPLFDRQEQNYIRDFSRETGLPIMVHVNGPEGIEAAIEMGAATIEHGYFMDDANLARMKERGTVWVPTVAPFGNAVLYDRWIPGWNKDLVKQIYEDHMKTITKAFRMGVYILPGSDAGSSIVPHGSGSFDEHKFLKTAKEKAQRR